MSAWLEAYRAPLLKEGSPGNVELLARLGSDDGRPQMLARYAGRIYLMQAGYLEHPQENESALRELDRIYLRSPEEARVAGRCLEEFSAGIYPLSLEEAMDVALGEGISWEPPFEAAPAVAVVRTYRDEGTPVNTFLLLLLFLALLFPAILLSPSHPAGVMLDEASRLPTVGILVLALLLTNVLLVSRSVQNAVSWWRVLGHSGRRLANSGPLLWWGGQTLVLLAVFTALGYAFLGLL